MYLEHFHLKEKPFQISADPRFLWLGSKHKEALAILKYGIFDNRGFLLLSGDVGTGKTTLIHALLRSLGADTLVAMVPDPGLSLMDFYSYIAKAFGITTPFDTKEHFLEIFKTFLLRSEKLQKKVLLIIDESQRLTSDLLEEIRLLSNIEKDYTKLLNIFFVGQNEFNSIILEQRNRPLRQRITINYNIEPLEKHEVMEYIRYRLAVAGCEAPLFSTEAVRDIYTFSEGYPRLINIVCDHALLTTFVQGAKQVDDATVRECAEELRIKMVTPRSQAPPAAETLVHAVPPPAAVIPPPYPAPPAPEPKASSSQTLLLIIFGLLCFIAGLLAFTLRDQPRVAERDNRTIVVTDTLPRERRPPATVEAAEAGDPESSSLSLESPPDKTRHTAPPANAPSDAAESSVAPATAADRQATPALTTPTASVAAVLEATRPPEDSEPPAEALPTDAPLPDKLILYFRADSNDLSDEALRELDQLVAAMKRRPSVPIKITGYTDAVGNLHYNFKVSEFRANIVKSFLVGRGLDAQRIESRGLGPANPIASNDTVDGRRLNRRVEIELIAKQL
ncbi:MAG: AAA family ATPase [Desulfobacterales bacterium]|nr:AAA family ATPase [Desulfobacterales bacterium]